MKLVKLNRRYKAFKDYGHKWAFRWNSYEPKSVAKVEKIMQDMHGSQYFLHRGTQLWRGNFGHASAKNGGLRPYWVSFTDEADATMILLQLDAN